jgi:hypothetical protein
LKGYKGFNKDLKCRDFQFEIGKEYQEERARACETGFHFCENPMDVLGYYAPDDSRYCEIEADGDIDRHGEDSKVACTKIKIGAEIGLPGLIKAGVNFILERVQWDTAKEYNTGNWSAATNTGDRSAATNTGNWSAATNTGDWSAATNTGDRSAATNTGYQSAATNTGNWSAATNTGYQSAACVEGQESVAMAIGYQSKAKGALGCWLVLSEWKRDADDNWHIADVQSTRIDGEIIKADTWYELADGQFMEVID